MQNLFENSTIALLRDEFERIGYTYKSFELGERQHTRFVSRSGESWLTSNTRINYPFISNSARPISTQKYWSYELASSFDITIPITMVVEVGDLEPEVFAMLKLMPLIVKPDNASMSHGLQRDVTNADEMIRAIAYARTFSEKVLVQKQLTGEEVRFVVLDGKITAAILRQTPRLIGDGVSTIKMLLQTENEVRRQLNALNLTYPQLEEPLIDLSTIKLSRVPDAGEIVELGRSTMIGGGASMYNVLEDIHPTYIQTAKKLAKYLGNGFVVVDMFIDDYTQPQTALNYAFIEFNMSPSLKVFYSCRDMHHYDILPELVRMIDRAVHREGVH